MENERGQSRKEERKERRMKIWRDDAESGKGLDRCEKSVFYRDGKSTGEGISKDIE